MFRRVLVCCAMVVGLLGLPAAANADKYQKAWLAHRQQQQTVTNQGLYNHYRYGGMYPGYRSHGYSYTPNASSPPPAPRVSDRYPARRR